MKLTLTVIGVVLDLAGIILVASPELMPIAKPHVRRQQARMRRIQERFGRPPRPATSVGSLTVAMGHDVELAIVAEGDDSWDAEKKLNYLMIQARSAQRRLNAVERGLKEERRERTAGTMKLERSYRRSMTAMGDAYIGQRRIGLILVACGSVVLGFANLV